MKQITQDPQDGFHQCHCCLYVCSSNLHGYWSWDKAGHDWIRLAEELVHGIQAGGHSLGQGSPHSSDPIPEFLHSHTHISNHTPLNSQGCKNETEWLREDLAHITTETTDKF